MTGQSWLLGGGYPWRTLVLGRDPEPIEAAVVVNDRDGLSLAPLAAGPWGLESPDGSLGRLTLPAGVAVWGDVVVVLSAAGDRVWRYDPAHRRAVPLAEIGMDGLCPPFDDRAHLEPRRFRRAAGIALFRTWLYVADPEAHRVQVFDLETLVLVRVHAGQVDPIDVAAGPDGVVWVDRARGRVYLDHPRLATPRRVVEAPYRAGRWDRIAVDRAGRIYLRDTGSLPPGLDVFEAPGRSGRARPLGRVRHPAEVRDRFAEPRVVTDASGALVLDDRLLEPCGVRRDPATPAREGRVTRDGLDDVAPARPAPWPAPAYERSGVWISQWLDSGIYDCQWDVVTVTLAALPPGAAVTVRTRTVAAPVGDTGPVPPLAVLADLGSWSPPVRLIGEAQPASGAPPAPTDLLVASPSGQYLQVLVELAGDGRRSPIVGSVRTRFPRESWLQYLPAVYSQPDDQRVFLDRYLAIAQATWSGLEREVESFERYLDPRSAPPEALPYLAGWLDLQLEGSLTADQHRRLIAALPAVWRRWGTIAGLRDWVRVHLSVLTGLDPEVIAAAGLPGIVERFVERRHVLLQPAGTSRDAVPLALWSPAVERRFQVGVFDREGEVEIVSAGHPDEDVFRHYAHAFRVYVPAAWVATPAAQALLRRAIDLQRPAHTTFSLVLVEPRCRVGDQSTLDLDCVIGGDVPSRLGGAGAAGADAGAAGARLGYDATLGGLPRRSPGGATLG